MTETAPRRSEKRAKLLALIPQIEADIRSHLSLTLIYERRVKEIGISFSYFHQLVTDRLGLSRTRFPGRATKARLRKSSSSSEAPTQTTSEAVPIAPDDAKPHTTQSPMENTSAHERPLASGPRRFKPHEGPAKSSDLW
jgi:hypothetical protein